MHNFSINREKRELRMSSAPLMTRIKWHFYILHSLLGLLATLSHEAVYMKSTPVSFSWHHSPDILVHKTTRTYFSFIEAIRILKFINFCQIQYFSRNLWFRSSSTISRADTNRLKLLFRVEFSMLLLWNVNQEKSILKTSF